MGIRSTRSAAVPVDRDRRARRRPSRTWRAPTACSRPTACRHPGCSSPASPTATARVLYEAHPAPTQVLPDRRRPHGHRRAPAGRAARHRRQRPHRPAGRGQDRDRRRQHRRLVRRLHARARRRGLGRRPRVGRHRDATARHADHRASAARSPRGSGRCSRRARSRPSRRRSSRRRSGSTTTTTTAAVEHDHALDRARHLLRRRACTCSRRSRRSPRTATGSQIVRAPSRRYPPNYVIAQDPPGRQPGAPGRHRHPDRGERPAAGGVGARACSVSPPTRRWPRSARRDSCPTSWWRCSPTRCRPTARARSGSRARCRGTARRRGLDRHRSAPTPDPTAPGSRALGSGRSCGRRRAPAGRVRRAAATSCSAARRRAA